MNTEAITAAGATTIIGFSAVALFKEKHPVLAVITGIVAAVGVYTFYQLLTVGTPAPAPDNPDSSVSSDS